MISSQAIEHTLRTVFRRCYQCPDEKLSCPTCNDGEYCSQILSSCTQCASAVCVKMDGSPGSEKKSASTNVGAIAGGVVGGIAAVLIVTFLVWKFYYKGKRRQAAQSVHWSHVDVEQEKSVGDFTMRRDARASTHTVASIASSVLTRASNIIQIAYIPGVTNRSGAPSPGTLAPPVPPIPSAHSSPASPYLSGEQHFFVPGNLRDSSYSGMTAGRSSISPSLARSSVATTIYRNNAVVSPLPAQTIVRGKAAVVSVKSSSSGSPSDTPGAETPPVPLINYDELPKDAKSTKPAVFKIQMPHSSDKPGTSPHGSLRSVQIGKPKALTITKGKKQKSSRVNETIDIAAAKHSLKNQSDDGFSDDEVAGGQPDDRDSLGITRSPFADSIEKTNLETVIEEATKRASKDGTTRFAKPRTRSPFDDENALKED